MTSDTLAKLQQAYAFGASDLEACAYADVHQATLYRFLKENQDFRDLRDRLKERPTLLARQTVVQAIRTDPNLAFNFLTRKQRREFSERIETDVTTADQPITTNSEDVMAIAQRVAAELKQRKTS